MKDFYFVEKDPDLRKFDWNLMPLFAPQTTLELVRGNLMKLCSASQKMERNIQVFKNGILLSEIVVCNGRIIHEKPIADTRTNAEIDADFFYENKAKRSPSVVRSRLSNDWFLSDHYEEDPNRAKRMRMRVRPEKRNTTKVPG
ncbi:MAG: hypothetical protein V1944_00480 [Candidatus Aenigmatarchaeota archaeon]